MSVLGIIETYDTLQIPLFYFLRIDINSLFSLSLPQFVIQSTPSLRLVAIGVKDEVTELYFPQGHYCESERSRLT